MGHPEVPGCPEEEATTVNEVWEAGENGENWIAGYTSWTELDILHSLAWHIKVWRNVLVCFVFPKHLKNQFIFLAC